MALKMPYDSNVREKDIRTPFTPQVDERISLNSIVSEKTNDFEKNMVAGIHEATRNYLMREDQIVAPIMMTSNEVLFENVSDTSFLFWTSVVQSPRSLGSWDLPAGPVAWQDNNNTLENLLSYADLNLTEEEENGLLTDRIIAACASYITRSPASKCHILAKVCLDNKNLNDIRIIGHHKFLQYVDLSWNNLKDLSPLGQLPYLMYLDVSHNLLEDVLHFKPPWNLTYVNYSHNDVWQINDLSEFWSLTYLDLSHNKISKIQGLSTLRYLRYLNLSHNKITRFENLNHTRITDLNLDYNIISSFEIGPKLGVKTLLDLTSLSLNNNLISDLAFLEGVYHLKKLELQGNRISNLSEFSTVRSLRKLNLLDLTGNPITRYKSYRHLLLNFLPELKYLDLTKVDMDEKISNCQSATAALKLAVAKNNTRLILMDQFNDTKINLELWPVDQALFPLVILVGPSASYKKVLVSAIGEKYPDKVFIGKLLTTREVLETEKTVLTRIRREELCEKITAGEVFCVMEQLGHLYAFSMDMLGFSVKSHKLCLTFMDLEGALTVHSYGIQPHLVLTLVKKKADHEKRLHKLYGAVTTWKGAVLVGKREFSESHSSNIRRIKVILNDLIEKIILLVEEESNLCFASSYAGSRHYFTSQEYVAFPKTDERRPLMDSEAIPVNKSRMNSVVTSRDDSFRKYDNIPICPPDTCDLQERYKRDPNNEENAHHDPPTISSSTYSNSPMSSQEMELRDEGSGTCSTSYSAIMPQAIRMESASLIDEDELDGENDIFADWSTPFIDWDEINVDPIAEQEAADELCRSFVERILGSRTIYKNMHLDNPGLFSFVLIIEDKESAMNTLVEYLKEVWRNAPKTNPLVHMENDLAYKDMVPKKMERLKDMITGERSCSSSNVESCVASKFATINSPRSIITQVQLMGYKNTLE